MTDQTIVRALADWFKKPLAKLPREKRRIAEFHIKNWAKLSPTGRHERAVEVDRQQVTKRRIRNDKVRRMLNLAERDPTYVAEYSIGFDESTLDAATWWGLNRVTPCEAAMLLCHFNPHNDTLGDATKASNDETAPDDFKRLLRVFEDVAQADTQARTLRQWRDIARGKKMKYHSWIDKYEAAVRLTANQAKGDDSQKADSGGTTKSLPAGVPSAEIIENFKLDDAWDNKLRHVNDYRYLKPALMQPGSRTLRTKHLWNPVEFAEILIKRKRKLRSAMARIIEHRFPNWQDAWELAQSVDEPDDWGEGSGPT